MSAAEPLSEEELREAEDLHLRYGVNVINVPRVLATIRARDEEIARLREERDAAKASALALHHIAFRQA